ncbi:FxLD family lanthipeptide [Sciscionella marina]|uniref:FxLD family lanthipeptide n=1 Tax=Sciscionella marina TaxID=508770 RepID=UPI0003796307
MSTVDATLASPEAVGEDGFRLEFAVIESAVPLAKLGCNTSDGCGHTCQGSACNSQANNPS